MNLFIYDAGRGREWSVLFGEAVRLTSPRPGALDGGTPGLGDVVICHRPDTEQQAIDACADRGAVVIEIAGHHRESRPVVGSYYHRSRAVAGGADLQFQACVRNFINSLRRDEVPRWGLLEGPPPPKDLLAYHFLCLTGQDGAGERDALRASAIAEAEAIAAATNRPRLKDVDDPIERGEFIRSCS